MGSKSTRNTDSKLMTMLYCKAWTEEFGERDAEVSFVTESVIIPAIRSSQPSDQPAGGTAKDLKLSHV
jgi:hypothetical protein